ncbi:glycosyltransferase family 4 protein [Cohnella cellulosilytica]|uniref:Glycosyltransferase family 4 protein n=1 Tax=Cohnella cellulosilytica TaxID=986710 RepID=A0ABW2FED3_9BACL
MSAKICHMTSVHRYDDPRIFRKECKSLSDMGYEVHLIAPGDFDQKINGVFLHKIKINSGNRLKRMTVTVREVYKEALEINADLYHFHDPELITVGLMLRLKGKIVIYDVHEDVPRQILSKHWIPKSLRLIISFFFEKIENFSAKRFSAIVTATHFINRRFEKLNANSVNVNNYPILNELTNSHSIEEKENTVAYIGMITKIRGIKHMVEAIGRTNYRLVVGGKFQSVKEEEEILSMNEIKSVDLLGFLSREQVAYTLSKTRAGIIVSHPTLNYIDALPTKMFEYMACGLPVISSDFPILKEIVEGNECGICVNPLDTEEIREAINFIMNNLDESEIMGKNGKKAIENKYNWLIESEKLDQLYKKILFDKRESLK